MTISFGAAGTLTSHASSITPALPSFTAGQLAVLQVVSGHPDDPTPSQPSGWMHGGSYVSGGSFAAGAGPRRLTWFCRVLTGGDAAPSTAIPSGGTGSVIAGQVSVWSRSAGTGWRFAPVFAADDTSGTGFSAAAGNTLTFAPGDVCLLGYGIALSSASLSAEAVTATGITFGAVTERTDTAVAVGHGARLAMASCSVSSGSGTQAPTVAATLSAASTGICGVLRLREATAAITASAQTADPPRNLVTVTGLLADDIASVTVYRTAGGGQSPVRAATDVDVSGVDALLRVDAEMPFGTAVGYTAVLTDAGGLGWTVSTSGTITSAVSSDIVSDAVQGLGAHVHVEAWDSKKRSRDATVFNVGGRLVVVGRPRSAPQATVTVSTDTAADGDALQAVLDAATQGVIQIRAQSSAEGVDGHYALLSDDERRNWQTPYREWDLETAETEAWADVLEARGFTYQDAADNIASYQDADDLFGTYLDAAQWDFGS